ncbi:MAG: sulfotransferase [Bacteroidetes bacterium]|nr:sulfotransferase [Bacteroidota bacterium]
MHPNFIVAGPPKCSSSSLHYYLGQHPEIYASKIKETRFFSLHYEKGMAYYETFFAEATNEKAIGETTPSYSFLPFVADRIKLHYPDIRLIFCLRNPIDRAFSSWRMQQGRGTETQSFREAIDINKNQIAIQQISLEGEEGARRWVQSHEKHDDDATRLRTYIQAGMYTEIIKSYRQRFDDGQIKIIFAEDLIQHFDETMCDLFRFLKVDEKYIVQDKEIVNYNFSRSANKLANKILGVKTTLKIAEKIPDFIKNKMKSAMREKEPVKLSFEDRLYVWDIFKEDVEKLEKLLNIDLMHWKPKLKTQA